MRCPGNVICGRASVLAGKYGPSVGETEEMSLLDPGIW
jgi:hypothetical protein